MTLAWRSEQTKGVIKSRQVTNYIGTFRIGFSEPMLRLVQLKLKIVRNVVMKYIQPNTFKHFPKIIEKRNWSVITHKSIVALSKTKKQLPAQSSRKFLV
jgi:hypothetical protein